ncbi:protein Dok-7 isoform X3 [Hippocampus comes]|uniref:protein Dok-7 isoform X3 n=1 Tax=Hippocampus comes TaxID=109280 RepID=UPI00094E077D|nr:PREDICTED: protein Dok-7-like isoform X3 [Hippocampus comes]
MTDTVVAEGQVKFRDGKKWKTRWVVVRKPSPVADCLSVLAYKDKKKAKERLGVTLEGIYGVEPGPGYDGVSYTLSILCLAHTLVLGFHSREALLAWDSRVRYSLGEVHRFGVTVEPGTKLEIGPASLHLCNNLLALTRGLPPAIIGHWKLSSLRRYGAVPNGFVFEGGTRCGFWAGVFFLSCSDGEQISFLFDCIVRGINPSRATHGLRPSLPAETINANPASVEERLNQEACELEKRLSMLSTCSLASSTASTYSCSTSVAGDDRSSISSSSSSQSDTSYGSRHPFWAEPFVKLHLPSETALSSSSLKALATSDDRLYAAVMGGCGPSSTQLHPRGLHDSGRQSSLDSGIGIATGSSGSFSSCTGSVDMATQGAGEEFGSLATLSAPPPSAPPPPPNPSPSQSTPHQEHSGGPSRLDDERQSSGLLRQRYDTPRSLIQNRALKDPSAGQEHPSETGRDSAMCRDRLASQDRGLTDGLPGSQPQRQALMQCPLSWLSDRTPPMDNEEKSAPQQLFVAGTSLCEEIQPCQSFDNYITPEQWRTANSRSLPMQVGNSSSGPRSSADSSDQLCATHHDCHDGDLIRMLSSMPASSPLQPIALSTARTQSAYEGSIDRYSHGNNGAMATAQREGGEHALGRGGQLTRMDNRRQGPLR